MGTGETIHLTWSRGVYNGTGVWRSPGGCGWTWWKAGMPTLGPTEVSFKCQGPSLLIGWGCNTRWGLRVRENIHIRKIPVIGWQVKASLVPLSGPWCSREWPISIRVYIGWEGEFTVGNICIGQGNYSNIQMLYGGGMWWQRTGPLITDYPGESTLTIFIMYNTRLKSVQGMELVVWRSWKNTRLLPASKHFN